MQIVDTGVLTPSFMDFSLPSEFAKSALITARSSVSSSATAITGSNETALTNTC